MNLLNADLGSNTQGVSGISPDVYTFREKGFIDHRRLGEKTHQREHNLKLMD